MQKDFKMPPVVGKIDGGGHPKPNRLVVNYIYKIKKSAEDGNPEL